MENTDVYFGNKVALFGKVHSLKEETPEFMALLLETKEMWGEEVLLEHHEVRFYRTPHNPDVQFQNICGKLIEVAGRIRLKAPALTDYLPFVHCHKLNVVDA